MPITALASGENDNISLFFDLIEAELGTDWFRGTYFECLKTQRPGQAFYNALPNEYRGRIIGTNLDPFYKEGPGCVYDAIDFLTS